ncbi:MAG: redoxin domain-containing protein [Bryobacterales bacterium]|nr:redoxin domain-containing protein [Bryobacterales bacterium]
MTMIRVKVAISFLAVAALCHAKRFHAEGVVLRVDPAARTVLISHRAIPGYMDAMAMPFRAANAREIANLKPGEAITFDLVVSGTRSRIERIRTASKDSIEDDSQKINLTPPAERLSLGAPVPDFQLTDQAGETVRLSAFKGKVVAVNFIYTRCPLPEVCPRLSANFAQVQRRFADLMGKDVVLLSLTLDPQYDTTATLAAYAKIWRAEHLGWKFLTGSEEDIGRVARAFGMVYWPEEGLVAHTSETGVIGRGGQLSALVSGSSFTAAQIGDLIAAELEIH